jgi:hypothetical protein
VSLNFVFFSDYRDSAYIKDEKIYDKDKQLKEKEEELRKMQEMVAKMQAQMQAHVEQNKINGN